MKIQEILCEVLASPYPYSIRQAKGNVITATFETPAGLGYRYFMTLTPKLFKDGTVAVEGDVRFSDEGGRTGVTGEGDAFRIMATVLDITKKLASKTLMVWDFLSDEYGEDFLRTIEDRDGQIPRKVEILEFSADPEEPSRVRLYRRLAKSIPGYSVFESGVGDFTLIANNILDKKQEILGG
jgi:hypothetical protein